MLGVKEGDPAAAAPEMQSKLKLLSGRLAANKSQASAAFEASFLATQPMSASACSPTRQRPLLPW